MYIKPLRINVNQFYIAAHSEYKETIEGSLDMECPLETKFGGVRINQLTLFSI